MTETWLRLITAVTMIAALASCDSDFARPGASEPSPAPTLATYTGPCPNVDDAAERGSSLGGGSRGDVDGDGADDDVFLLRDPEGPPGCADLLFVETADAVLAAELSDGREYALPQPRLNALVEIDERPGAEIVVDLEQGASTQFVGLFTVADGTLERVRLPGSGGLGDLFPYGWSVGHIEASDCAESPGTVIVSVATPTGDRYEVERSVYRFQGAQLRIDRDASEKILVAPEEVQDLPEYRSPPFGSCAYS